MPKDAAARTCVRCPRLVAFRRVNAQRYPDYHNAPVEPWGGRGSLLVVGLAPGLKGANRTGRPFTGDASGRALFEALMVNDFAVPVPGQPEPEKFGVRLRGCTITNAVRCVPPGNSPVASEFNHCRPYLEADIEAFHPPEARRPRCIVTLGIDAHRETMRALTGGRGDFCHGSVRQLRPLLWLLASFHPSRRNMNNGKLTQEMFNAVFARARQIVDGG